MKRIVSLFLCIVLCVSCLTCAVLANNEGLENFYLQNTYYSGQFWDVNDADWFSDGVRVAFELGLVKGESATSFNPNGNMKISEAITLASRLHSIYYNNGMEFIQGTPWYQVYVDYAVENGIVYTGQFYDYTAYATRAEFATILSAALPDEALPEVNYIETIPDVYGYEPYSDDVYKLYNAGILTGNDEQGTFAPYSTIRRCEVATIVSRMALPTMRREFSLSDDDTDEYSQGEELLTDTSSLDINVGEYGTVWVTAYRDDTTVTVEYDSDYVDTYWGDWDGYTVPLTVYALSEGYSQLEIYYEDDPRTCIYVDVWTYYSETSGGTWDEYEEETNGWEIYDYVGNVNPDSRKFHYDWCVSVDKMKESNKFYYTGTREDMIAMGYTPCKNCRP